MPHRYTPHEYLNSIIELAQMLKGMPAKRLVDHADSLEKIDDTLEDIGADIEQRIEIESGRA